MVSEFKMIDGKRYRVMSVSTIKRYAKSIAAEYRSGKRKYSGRKAKSVRVAAFASGYGVYVR